MQWRWYCHENKIFLLIVCLCTFSDLEERRDSGTGSALINICATHCDRHGGKRQVHTGVGRQPHKLITSIKCNTCYESICEESDRSFSLCPQAPSAPVRCIKSPCIKSPISKAHGQLNQSQPIIIVFIVFEKSFKRENSVEKTWILALRGCTVLFLKSSGVWRCLHRVHIRHQPFRT